MTGESPAPAAGISAMDLRPAPPLTEWQCGDRASQGAPHLGIPGGQAAAGPPGRRAHSLRAHSVNPLPRGRRVTLAANRRMRSAIGGKDAEEAATSTGRHPWRSLPTGSGIFCTRRLPGAQRRFRSSDRRSRHGLQRRANKRCIGHQDVPCTNGSPSTSAGELESSGPPTAPARDPARRTAGRPGGHECLRGHNWAPTYVTWRTCTPWTSRAYQLGRAPGSLRIARTSVRYPGAGSAAPPARPTGAAWWRKWASHSHAISRRGVVRCRSTQGTHGAWPESPAASRG
ncbi:hypothetical protein SAMN05428943_0454 [Streptomyces sp. 2314.4]|nr:hypothetical protein SAMN05428943_0454 [Streptomyces sp. 2314.4]